MDLPVPINNNLICLSLPETNKTFKIKDDIQFISRVLKNKQIMLPDRLTSQRLLLRCQQATVYEHNKDTELAKLHNQSNVLQLN